MDRIKSITVLFTILVMLTAMLPLSGTADTISPNFGDHKIFSESSQPKTGPTFSVSTPEVRSNTQISRTQQHETTSSVSVRSSSSLEVDGISIDSHDAENVTKPEPGTWWHHNFWREISWEGFTGSDVTIKLQRRYYQSTLNYFYYLQDRIIFTTTPNDGGELWNIPDDIVDNGYGYRIVIEDAVNSANIAYSEIFYIGGPTIYTPTIDDSYAAEGGEMNITYGGFLATNVYIALHRGGAFLFNITDSTLNTGEFIWTISNSSVAADLYYSDLYQIRVFSMDDSEFDYSPTFVIAPPTVVMPDVTFVGDPTNIDIYGFTDTNVDIKLYQAGTFVMDIATNHAHNTDDYNWTIPSQTFGGTYTINVTGVNDGTQNAASNTFYISNPQIISPTSGEIYEGNYSITVEWSEIVATTLTIYLLRIDGSGGVGEYSVDNDGSHTFVINPTLKSYNYTVRIVSDDYNYQIETEYNIYIFNIQWHQPFYINTINSKLNMNETKQLRWSGFTSSFVKLELYHNGVLNQTINNIPNVVSPYNDFDWTVPDNVNPDDGYFIRLVDTTNSSHYIESVEFWIVNLQITNFDTSSIVYLGSTYLISYSGFINTSNVKLLYRPSGSNIYSTIISSTPNTGGYTWTIPTSALDYTEMMYLWIESVEEAGMRKILLINIQRPPIISPTDGASIVKGAYDTFEWSNFSGSQVEIYYYSTSYMIATGLENNGSATVFVDISYPISSTNARNLYIRSMDQTWVLNSIQVFLVSPSLVSPDANFVGASGENIYIEYSGFSVGDIIIELWNDSELVAVIDSNANYQTATNYLLPTGINLDTNYWLKIYHEDRPNEILNTPQFTIADPQFQGISQDDGINFQETVLIQWSGIPGATVDILLIRFGSSWLIASATPNNGSYTWVVPYQFDGSGYHIEIRYSTTIKAVSPDFVLYFNYLYGIPLGGIFEVIDNLQIAHDGFYGNLALDLYNSTGYVMSIVSSFSQTYAYNWNIPNDLPSGEYYIRGYSVLYPEDYTNTVTFFISNPEILHPQGGEIFLIGEVIELQYEGFIGSVLTIRLFKSSTSIYTFTTTADNNGSIFITIPDVDGGQNYYFKITSSDESYDSESFGIAAARLTNPTEDSFLYAGDYLNIVWDPLGGSTVMIQLFDGAVFITNITESTTDNGVFSYYTNSTLASSVEYNIKITNLDDTTITAVSDQFAIFNYGFIVPYTPLVWGVPITVEWYGFIGDEVSINAYGFVFLLPNNGSATITIDSPSLSSTSGFNFIVYVSGDSNRQYLQTPGMEFARPFLSGHISSGTPVFTDGDSINLGFQGYFSTTNVWIELHDETGFIMNITDSTPYNQNFQFDASVLTPGHDYYIVVTSIEHPLQKITSILFYYSDPEVISPADTSLEVEFGDTLTVTWSGFHHASLRISIVDSNSGSDTGNSFDVENTGSYDLTLPALQAGVYLIKISTYSPYLFYEEAGSEQFTVLVSDTTTDDPQESSTTSPNQQTTTTQQGGDNGGSPGDQGFLDSSFSILAIIMSVLIVLPVRRKFKS